MKISKLISNTFLISVVIICLPMKIIAQEALDNLELVIEEKTKKIEKKVEALGIELGYAIEYHDPEVKLGAYLDDLNFEDAYAQHYPYCHGVYISSVVKGGNSDQAGIRGGDIIMEFDGEKVLFERHLMQLRDSKNVGDTVKVKIFRNENEIETQLTFAKPIPKISKEAAERYPEMKKRKKLHPGYGGGGPSVILLDADFTGINGLLEANGFSKLTDDYMPLFGGFGMGNVGKGWFIGGGGYGYEKSQKISVDNGTRRFEYNIGFGGMTINKKIALLKNVVFDLGLLVGGGGASIEIRETDGDYSWTDDFDDNPNYYSLKYRKAFFAYRPSTGVLIRILPWLGIHGSIGYLGTYSFNDDWKDDYFDYTVSGDSPKVFDGISYSLDVWFGH